MKKYNSYKNSGIEWLGEIPESWEVSKLKYIVKFISGFPFNSQKFDKYNGINVIRIGDIKEKIDLSKCIKSVENENKIHKNILISKNDTLIALSGATTGKSCFINEKFQKTYINQRIAKFNYYNSFLYYCISNENFKKNILLGADGSAQENVSISTIENMLIPFPPKQEQEKIASFLDEKIDKIDKLIKQKEKLIKLLKERKEIVINDAVTKGLNKNVKMKNSGVEWLGEIPEHWEVKKLKFIMNKIQTGTTPSTNNKKFFNGNINWFNPKDLNKEILLNSENKISQLAINRREIKLFPKNSILIVGIGATTGKTSYLTINATFNQQITGFHSKNNDNKFLFYSLKNYSKIFLNIANYTTLPILNNEFFKSFEIPLPPLNEQEQIVEYIENEVSKIDKAVELQQNYINKLKEYKTTLIDNVVTGKVKVF